MPKCTNLQALPRAKLQVIRMTGKLRFTLVCMLQAPLLQVSRPSPLPLWPPYTVGNIYQRFTPEAEGTVENIIEFSVPGVLEGALQCGLWDTVSFEVLHAEHRSAQAHMMPALASHVIIACAWDACGGEAV